MDRVQDKTHAGANKRQWPKEANADIQARILSQFLGVKIAFQKDGGVCQCFTEVPLLRSVGRENMHGELMPFPALSVLALCDVVCLWFFLPLLFCRYCIVMRYFCVLASVGQRRCNCKTPLRAPCGFHQGRAMGRHTEAARRPRGGCAHRIRSARVDVHRELNGEDKDGGGLEPKERPLVVGLAGGAGRGAGGSKQVGCPNRKSCGVTGWTWVQVS